MKTEYKFIRFEQADTVGRDEFLKLKGDAE